MDDLQVAADMRARLADMIGQERFELWFGPHTQFRLNEFVLTVVAACTFTRDWLRRNFAHEVRSCCLAVTGRDVRVEFDVDATLAACGETVLETQIAMPASSPQATVSEAAVTQTRPPRSAKTVSTGRTPAKVITREPTLSAIVVGKGNEYAVRAAEVTAHGLQQASPVLFCGPTGVGKTQLLRAIRTDYRHSHPRARAVYLSAEQFVSGFVEALHGSGLPSFRSKCRGADMFLLDDLQIFMGKRATMDELLHTIDVMLVEGRQLVMASTLPLAELRPLGRELVSRLSSGLVCEIRQPDYEMRLGIVRQLAREMGIELGEGVAELIATNISAGAREIRGALHRLHAMSAAFDQPISRQLAEGAVMDLARQSTRYVCLGDVEQAVCRVFGIEAAQLRSDRKTRSVHEPRMLAMWLARKLTRAPWSEIGEHFGRRSHSTVISAHRRVETLIRARAEIGVSHEICGVEEAIRRVEAALRSA